MLASCFFSGLNERQQLKGLEMINSKTKQEMPSQRFKKSLLAVSIVALSAPVLAQTDNSSEETMEEVVVVGMRSSINSAQELKRNADTVKDVITSSDIGALPDKSVTEALQRVPGVTIERFAASEDPNHFADEGTGVLVRGLDRVRSEVNGRDAFSANPWGGLNYEDFSPELLKAVEVVKNQTADLISGGIAGTVNLITRKPFDSDDMEVAFSAKASYGDLREEVTPAYSGLFSDRWETGAGEFGFLIAGSASEFKSRGDGVGVANYYSRGDAFLGSYDQWGGLVNINANPGFFDQAGNPITEFEESPLDGPALPDQPAGSVYYAPGQFSLRTAENDREREGLTSSLQWQNTDETVVVTLEHIYSKATLEWEERVIGTQGQGFAPSTRFGAIWMSDADHPLVIGDDGYLLSGIIRPHAELPMSMSSRWNYDENTVEDTSFNLKLKPTDALTLILDYQHIDSEQITHNYGINARAQAGSNAADAYIDLNGSQPKVEFISEKWTTPGTWDNWAGTNQDMFIATALDQELHSNAKADSYKIDAEYELDGLWTKISGGVYYSDKELVMRDTEYANWGAVNEGWTKAQVDTSSPLTNAGLWETVDFSDFYEGKVLLNAEANGTDYWFPKMDLVKNFTESMRAGCDDAFNADPGANTGWNNADGGATGSPAQDQGCYLASADLENRMPGSLFAQHDVTASNEQRTEAYIRADFVIDNLAAPIKGNFGLRYVNYQLESAGYIVLPSGVTGDLGPLFESLYPDVAEFADGSAQLQKVDGTDYTTVLPSFNLSIGLSDDVIMRFGASQGLYFPSLRDTRNSKVLGMSYTTVLEDPSQPQSETNPVVDIVGLELNGTARNPYLEPEESNNIDLTTEWYFAEAGSVAFGLFHKKIDNIIRERSFIETVVNPNNGVAQDFALAGPANTGSGSIQGYELSYSQFYDMLPGAWSGLGLQLNYTYIDQSGLNDPESGLGGIRFTTGGQPVTDARNEFRAFTGLPLQGYSDQNYNIVGMYEYSDVSFRLAYTWRSEYLVTRRDSNEFAPIYAEAAGYLDATLYYAITENVKIGLEASNLLDTQTKTRAQVNQEGRTMESLSFDTDQRYALSLRATF
jgi:iron complex outermembrane receptor protein